MSLSEFTGFRAVIRSHDGWGFEAQGLSRTLIEQQGNRIEIGLEMREKLVPLGKY
jgi:hypothetical protein